MDSVFLTLNAGSSSIKFAVFTPSGGELEQLASGQIEGLGARATFSVRSSSGEKQAFELGKTAERIDHASAVGVILDWLKKDSSR